MILFKVTFGKVGKEQHSEAEEIIQSYLSALLHNGQAVGESFYAVKNEKLCGYIHLTGIKGHLLKYHSKYGLKQLNKIKDIFSNAPQWELLDDDTPIKETTWKNSPFLFLFNDPTDYLSPIFRSDNGKPIPLYLLPGEHEDREKIYFWQTSYESHDRIWMECSDLEIPVYKQLATPYSELSENGRDICEYIEKVTGVPTYYYLMRYWGRKKNEEQRKCPCCGGNWTRKIPNAESEEFHDFHFQCDKCRLVSHVASLYDDERHAIIGEWKPKKRKV